MGNRVHNSFYTPMGLVDVEYLAHGSIHIDWEGMQIYVDPYSATYDFTGAPKADLILITHAHTDHYDCRAIEKIATLYNQTGAMEVNDYGARTRTIYDKKPWLKKR